MRKPRSLNIYLSTLNFVLCFVGYPLAASLFLPLSSDIENISRTVTVPYRALALVVAVTVLMFNINAGKKLKSLPLKFFWGFWLFLVIRVFYDVFLRSDVSAGDVSQLWLYIFGVCLLPMYALQKSYHLIDVNLALSWIFTGVILILIASLFNNNGFETNSGEVLDRSSSSLAVNTITFGNIGVMGIILSLFMLLRKKTNFIKNLLYFLAIALSIFTLLKAGSRGPLLALILVMLFWNFSRGKNIFLGVIISLLLIIITVIFSDNILHLIGKISPILELRMDKTIDGGDTSGRNILLNEAFNSFLENPLFGSQFALMRNNGFINAHNIVMDAFMGLGVFGGVILIYVLFKSIQISYWSIKLNNPSYWIGLLLVHQIFNCLTSGALYYEQLVNVILVFTFTNVVWSLSLSENRPIYMSNNINLSE